MLTADTQLFCRAMTLASVVAGAGAAQDTSVDALLRKLDAEAFDARTLDQLVDAGELAVPGLIRAATRRPPAVRDRALRALRAIGADAASAVDDLSEAILRPSKAPALSPERIERMRALLRTLNSLVLATPAAAARLQPHLDAVFDRACAEGQPAEAVRLSYRWQLAALGPDELVASMTPDDPLRWEIAAARMARAAHPRRFLPDLVAEVESTGYPMSMVYAFRSRQLAMVPSVSAEMIHSAAQRAIAEIDPASPHAVGGLGILLREADRPGHRVAAARALGRHTERAMPAVPALIEALADDDTRVVAAALTALGMIGDASDAVIAALRPFSTGENAELAARAVAALRALGR